MSRIGKQHITLPKNVTIEQNDRVLNISGPRGALSIILTNEVEVRNENGVYIVGLSSNELNKKSVSLWGLTKRLIENAAKGVSEGFSKKMFIEGVGYRAEIQGKDLVLSLGFSHPVRISAPEGIQFNVDKNTLTVSGNDKYLVGQVAANIRVYRKPEPYKGKGIRYEGERVRRKAGKKAAA
ncbi:MAG: 50S ribosomal protein L6 [Candidatus Spechtbacteria bacterium]|nr:50S ribosomal protein L6 [Candidatus Spechtbacteria bacterium]